MNRELNALPVIDSILSAEALVPVLQREFDIGKIGDCVLERGYANDVYRLTTIRGARHYFKVYRRDWRSASDVEWELRIQEHLVTGGVSIARPITRRDGLHMTVLGAPEGGSCRGSLCAGTRIETPGTVHGRAVHPVRTCLGPASRGAGHPDRCIGPSSG